MRFNWKLSHKGIILVSVPLVFELIFVLALAGLLKHAEHKAWTSKKGKEIVVRVGNWSKHLIEAHVMLVNYGFMHDPAALLAYERRLAQIPEVEKKLRVLAEDFPQVVPNLDRMQEYNRRMVIIMEESRHAIEGGGTMRMIPIARRIFVQMKTSYQPFMHEVEDITQQVHKFSASDAEEKRTMDIVWAVLVAGIAFNIVLTIVLAIFFSKGITSRLSVLVDNTIKMKERKPLSAPIAGTDEIAELDRVFHEMADALGRAERQKQDFVSMISHDLRSPLTALQTTLAMANKGSYGQLNDKGKKRIEAAEASVERLIKLINELLDIEKMEA
ncbi:MAG TPA: HAMP domain-containing sensor histidine kinase, partial [Candidatus Obscuribacterales bacterium]